MTRTQWLATSLVLCLACGDDGMMTGDDGGERCESDGDCDDGSFCNGVESCVEGVCQPGDDPCPGLTCDDTDDECGTTCQDVDGDGATDIACGGTDCDDTNADVNPGATEVCDEDDLDEDCNGDTFGFRDADGDGVPDAACCNGDTCGTDCDDANANIGFGLSESCDGLDNDCDGSTDEGALTSYYPDMDGDDFGDPDGTVMMACAQPDDYSENDDDCNDTSAAVNPGVSESCDQFGNNDCNEDTANPFDPDGDGFDTFNASSCPAGLDCDGANGDIYPGAPEICDGRDSNCDGAEAGVDCGCSGTCQGLCTGECDNIDYSTGLCNGSCTFGDCVGTCSTTCDGGGMPDTYAVEDYDNDGELSVGASCTGGPLGSLPRTDCNDGDSMMAAGIPEVCDGKDNDCDMTVDEASYFHIPGDDVDLSGLFADGPLDFSCLGSRSITLGASTSSSIVVPWLQENEQPLSEIQLWTDSSVPSTTCSGDCTIFGGTLGGVGSPTTVSVTHLAGAEVGLVQVYSGSTNFADSALYVTRPPEAPLPIETDGSVALTAGGAGLYHQLVDCNGRRVASGYLLRVYASSAPTDCADNATTTERNLGYFSRFSSGYFDATGEVVTLEAIGKVDGVIQVMAREQVRLRADTISSIRLPPLRADSPPAP